MKSRFLTALVLIHVSDNLKRLAYPLEFESASLGRVITVPAGFETDLASVPRVPLAYLLFAGVGDGAAVVHDFLYSTGQCSRKQADDVFVEAAKACGVSSWRRGLMWLGIRIGGAGHYRTAG